MESRPTYADAGVDIELAQQSLLAVGEAVAATYNDSVLGGIGAFGGMFRADFSDLTRPVLVTSIDGVGTKTKIAHMADDYSGIGHDIVNHCVNDILCQGARPLFFLDYFGCSRLEAAAFHQVVTGAAEACQAVGCALIGGETAEMPGVYEDGEIDIVGSVVGVVEESARLPRPRISAGDRLIGLASNGLHTNGYSLARKVLFQEHALSVRDGVPGFEELTLADALLAPHTNYFPAVYPLLQPEGMIKAVAHITGGGLFENLPRVLPANVQAKITRRAWTPLPIFEAIQSLGQIPDDEMFRTFNMGIGMVLICDNDASGEVISTLESAGVHAAEIGKIQPGSRDVQIA